MCERVIQINQQALSLLEQLVRREGQAASQHDDSVRDVRPSGHGNIEHAAHNAPVTGDRMAPAKLHESVLQEGEYTRSARGRLGPHPLLVGNGVVQLPHEGRRRLPAEVSLVGILNITWVACNRCQNLIVLGEERVPTTAYLLIGRVGHRAHFCVDDDEDVGDLLSLIAYLSMHRKSNAVPCFVTHASERGKMIDRRGEVSGVALTLRVAQNALPKQLCHMLLVGEDVACLNGSVCWQLVHPPRSCVPGPPYAILRGIALALRALGQYPHMHVVQGAGVASMRKLTIAGSHRVSVRVLAVGHDGHPAMRK
eukprot:2735376-Pleurochrysis_carterae.AAC.1